MRQKLMGFDVPFSFLYLFLFFLKFVQGLFDQAVQFVSEVDFSHSRTSDTVRQAFFNLYF